MSRAQIPGDEARQTPGEDGDESNHSESDKVVFRTPEDNVQPLVATEPREKKSFDHPVNDDEDEPSVAAAAIASTVMPNFPPAPANRGPR